ncbi:6-phosphogluconate dehydrogenase [Sphaerosporella brunnea]|uniref:6-phosphogluconate dehydrogenase n=1 Tax=Sphaerosporella brunnea TaxID=1250544 RepID=A0A5J5EJQ1_9PEZI|nr:6-phosphogluconate dehydrogenase [Sphaerosporella brunnea]
MGSGTTPRFLDGAIFGSPPAQLVSGRGWRQPRISVSGAAKLDPEVERILNIRSVGPEVGQTSTLKMCFASVSKGLQALSLMAFTTAASNGMADVLKEELEAFAPPFGGDIVSFLQKVVKDIPGKAFRWVEEIENISDTHKETGFGEEVFRGVAEIYRFMAEETEFGRQRVWGKPMLEVVEDVGESLKGSKKRAAELLEEGEEEAGKRRRVKEDLEEEDKSEIGSHFLCCTCGEEMTRVIYCD